MLRRSATAERPAMSSPSISMTPAVGSIIRLIMRSSVVLPDPLEPTSTVVLRAGMTRSKSRTAAVPSGYSLETPRNSIMVSFMSLVSRATEGNPGPRHSTRSVPETQLRDRAVTEDGGRRRGIRRPHPSGCGERAHRDPAQVRGRQRGDPEPEDGDVLRVRSAVGAHPAGAVGAGLQQPAAGAVSERIRHLQHDGAGGVVAARLQGGRDVED